MGWQHLDSNGVPINNGPGRSTYSSTPPANPLTGDLWVLPADSTNGVNWTFRYNASSASSFKWEFVGGPPLYAEVTPQQSTTSTTYTDLTTVGPAITLPRAGDYDVEGGAIGFVGANQVEAMMSYAIGATAAVDADRVVKSWSADGGAPLSASAHNYASRKRRKTGLTAVTLTAKYKSTNASISAFFVDRWLAVTPVRIS